MSSSAHGVVLVLTTIAAEADGAAFARTLVGERLAACVSVLPGLRSTYRWEGAIERSEEVLLLAKTVPEGLPALQARIVALHPYELPEVLAVEAAGLPAYLAWIAREVDAPTPTA